MLGPNHISFIAGSLQSQTQVILASTIHFKAPWQIPFEKEETRKASFHLNSNEQTQVAMRTAEDDYPYGDLQELDAQAVVIPYRVSSRIVCS